MERSKKAHELAYHLGNVLNVVSDRKISVQDGSTGNTDYYLADVVSYSDYYPFGMLKPGRHGNSESYRYSLQSKEKDDEWAGEGNSVDFGNRMYDTRLGRFRSMDRLAKLFPHFSPYLVSGNTPIMAIDEEGDSLKFASEAFTEGERAVLLKVLVAEKLGKDAYLRHTVDQTGLVTFNNPENAQIYTQSVMDDKYAAGLELADITSGLLADMILAPEMYTITSIDDVDADYITFDVQTNTIYVNVFEFRTSEEAKESGIDIPVKLGEISKAFNEVLEFRNPAMASRKAVATGNADATGNGQMAPQSKQPDKKSKKDSKSASRNVTFPDGFKPPKEKKEKKNRD